MNKISLFWNRNRVLACSDKFHKFTENMYTNLIFLVFNKF